jgi:hypothetical protein
MIRRVRPTRSAGSGGRQLQVFGPMLQLPLQQSPLVVQNQVGLWQHLPLDPQDSPLAVSHVHGPPQPSSAPQTLPTSPPPTQPAVGVQLQTPELHTWLPPLHEPQLPPQPSPPQFLPAHTGTQTHAPALHALPVSQAVPSVTRAQAVVSVSVVVSVEHAPAVQVGVMAGRVRLPPSSQIAA